jgi:DNA helicase HerA-like ATPase
MHTTMNPDHNYILGTLSSGESVPLLQADRRRHVYVVGQTGAGKTGLLLSLMRADLVGGAGFCFIDPHGDAAQAIAAATPRARTNDVIYLDPSDPTHTFAYNPLSGIPEAERATAAANIVSAFKNIWGHSWGPRLEYVLSNALRLLLDNRDQSLLGIPRLFADDSYRRRLARSCADPLIKFYWLREFEALDNRQRAETLSPIQNKIGILLSNPFIRSILCQNASTIDIANIMNTGKVLIVNLSKGNLGTEPAHLLGALLITAISQAAEARRNIDEAERLDFTLYVDEFQNFATDSFASILSEARKWRLSLVAANQHVAQLSEDLQHAVFGNAGTIVAFRVGALDAPLLAGELGMQSPRALRETRNFQAWLRLMRNGAPLEPRLIQTSAPERSADSRLESVMARSRSRHTVPRAVVETRINRFISKTEPRRSRSTFKRRNPDG